MGRFIWPPPAPVDPAALAASQAEVARLNHEYVTGRSTGEALSVELKIAVGELRIAREESARLTERAASLTAQFTDQFAALRSVESQRDIAAQEANRLSSLVAAMTEREIALKTKVGEHAAQLADMQKQLTAEFENIANRVLKATTTELSDSSQKSLAAIVDPLRERIQEFQKKVETTFDAETRDVLSLKEQIRLMVETSHTIGNHADGLAKALRGDSQLLGRWGELALERILETAGLKEGREYVSQGRGLGLRNEDGGAQRPDIIIKLPEERTLIIDSKVPLTSYERLVVARDDVEVIKCRQQFVRDVKAHIDGLARKRYQDNEKLQAHDCVLMFIPIEGALAAALAAEPELFTYGWERRVVLVGPPTLLMTMRTVASIWRYEAQNQNAQEIGRLAGELCDKVSHSVTDLHDVSDRITSALNAHHDAVKRLSTGKGNALSIGQRIRDLGVKTRRAAPAILSDGISIVAANGDYLEEETGKAVEAGSEALS
jgi:DNA recombination protein RmuC